MIYIWLSWKLTLGYASIVDGTKHAYIDQAKVLPFNKYQ